MAEEKETKFKNVITIVTIIMTIIILLFVVYGIRKGVFKSPQKLVDYIKTFGPAAFIVFIFIQIIQVIFPIIPGGASCLAGVLAFGPLLGFVYNYIGLCLGSIVVFFLSRKYGLALILKLFKKETVEKYIAYIKNKKFTKVFFWGIFLPGAPDDLLCYIAGISDISFKKFFIIILLGKPLALYLYSLFMNVIPRIIK